MVIAWGALLVVVLGGSRIVVATPVPPPRSTLPPPLTESDLTTAPLIKFNLTVLEDVLDRPPSMDVLLDNPTFLNCTECKKPMASLKYNPKSLGAPQLEFPKPPQRSKDTAVSKMRIFGGVYYVKYIRQFLSYIQPYEFPISHFREYVQDRIAWSTFLTKTLHVEIGFLCCLLVGVGASLTVPCMALGRLCYRISHERPLPQTNCIGNCKRRTLVFCIELLLVFLLLGISGMLIANEQVSSSVVKVPNLTEAVIEDGVTYIKDAQNGIQHVVTQSMERALYAATSDLDNVENLLGRPVQSDLAKETGMDVALETLVEIESEAEDVFTMVEGIMRLCNEAEKSASTTRERLWELKHQVESTLRHCQARDRPLCDTISLQGLDVRFNTQPIRNDKLLGFLKQQNSNMSSSVAEAAASFQALPTTIERETKEARQGVLRQLLQHKLLLSQSLKSLETFTRELSHRIESSEETIFPNFSDLGQINFWTWLLGLCAGLSILLIWLLLLGAISCGCCGAERSSVPTLIITVVLVSILSLCLWTMALLVMVVGGHAETMVCRPLYEEPQFKVLTRLADDSGLIHPGGGQLLSDLLHEGDTVNLPFGQALESCHQNKSVYTTFGLERVFDVDKETNLNSWEDLRAALDEINVSLVNFQFPSPYLQMNLRDLSSGLSVNITSLRLQLSGPITNKDLESFANQLESVSTQINDLSIATHLETLASRSRRIISTTIDGLEEQKERLIYHLTALELKVAPLQKQVNQSLSHLKTIEYFISKQWSTISHQNLKEYTSRILNYFEQFRNHVMKTIQGNATTCRPLWDLFNATRLLLCRNIVDPINVFWFATIWCLVIFLIATPICLKLTDYYSQNKNFMGDISPSEMFLTEEQNSGWSTPGQREGDGW